MRNAFAAELTRLASADPRVVLLSGDIGNRLFDDYKQRCPGRFYNCGVAEANIVFEQFWTGRSHHQPEKEDAAKSKTLPNTAA